MKKRYRNPWFDQCLTARAEYYENDAPCVFSYRGVDVYKLWGTSYDYVLNGCCITQRAGFPKDKAERQRIIDDMLDGRQPCSERVAEWITQNGGHGLSYDDYVKKCQNGEME